VKQTLENCNTLRNYSGLSNINHPLLPLHIVSEMCYKCKHNASLQGPTLGYQQITITVNQIPQWYRSLNLL